MRFRAACLLTLALLLPAAPAGAFETPQLTLEQRQAVIRVGESFRTITHMFKCDDFAWGTVSADGRVVTLKYIPAGADFDAWTRMMTITVYALPDESMAAAELMLSLIQSADQDVRKEGRAIKSEPFSSKQHQPALFLDYVTGFGALTEHDVAAFVRTSRSAAALLTLKVRGDRKPEPSDAPQMRSLPDIAVLPPD
jgi:hypothetical protein